MSLTLNMTHLITIGVFLIGGLATLFWCMIKLIVRQFNASLNVRFTAAEKKLNEENLKHTTRFEKIEAAQTVTERALTKIQVNLANEYWRREDAIRNDSLTQAKLDGLARRLDAFFTRTTQ